MGRSFLPWVWKSGNGADPILAGRADAPFAIGGGFSFYVGEPGWDIPEWTVRGRFLGRHWRVVRRVHVNRIGIGHVVSASIKRIREARIVMVLPPTGIDSWRPPGICIRNVPEIQRRYAGRHAMKFGLAAGVMQALLMAPLSALAVVVMFYVLLSLTRSARASLWLAAAVATIWMVHPLQTESVTYIIQRAEGERVGQDAQPGGEDQVRGLAVGRAHLAALQHGDPAQRRLLRSLPASCRVHS